LFLAGGADLGTGNCLGLIGLAPLAVVEEARRECRLSLEKELNSSISRISQLEGDVSKAEDMEQECSKELSDTGSRNLRFSYLERSDP